MGFDHPELASAVAGFFGCMIGVFWWLCFMRGLMDENVKPLKFPERFDIGYIDEPQQQVVVVQEKPKKKKKKRKSVPNAGPRHVCTEPKGPSNKRSDVRGTLKPTPQGPSNELIADCVNALVSLGTKRGEARRVATKFLIENPEIQTVEVFITEIFRRRN